MAALFGTNICDGSENFQSQWFSNNNNTDLAGVAGPIYYVVTPNSLLGKKGCGNICSTKSKPAPACYNLSGRRQRVQGKSHFNILVMNKNILQKLICTTVSGQQPQWVSSDLQTDTAWIRLANALCPPLWFIMQTSLPNTKPSKDSILASMDRGQRETKVASIVCWDLPFQNL